MSQPSDHDATNDTTRRAAPDSGQATPDHPQSHGSQEDGRQEYPYGRQPSFPPGYHPGSGAPGQTYGQENAQPTYGGQAYGGPGYPQGYHAQPGPPPQPDPYATQPHVPGRYGPRPGSDDTAMSVLAHLLGAVTGFLGPLIMYVVKKDRAPYVRDQSAEALNFQITVLIAYAASAFLSLFLIGLLLFPLVWVGSLVFEIMGAVAANRGEPYRYPINIRMIT